MSYSPNNAYVFLAAITGCQGGLIAARTYPTNGPGSNFADSAKRADAFAQAVDAAWGPASYTSADLQQIQSAASSVWASGCSPVPGAAGLAASGYTGVAAAIVAATQAGTAQIVSEGVDPNGSILEIATKLTTPSNALTLIYAEPAEVAATTYDYIATLLAEDPVTGNMLRADYSWNYQRIGGAAPTLVGASPIPLNQRQSGALGGLFTGGSAPLALSVVSNQLNISVTGLAGVPINWTLALTRLSAP